MSSVSSSSPVPPHDIEKVIREGFKKQKKVGNFPYRVGVKCCFLIVLFCVLSEVNYPFKPKNSLENIQFECLCTLYPFFLCTIVANHDTKQRQFDPWVEKKIRNKFPTWGGVFREHSQNVVVSTSPLTFQCPPSISFSLLASLDPASASAKLAIGVESCTDLPGRDYGWVVNSHVFIKSVTCSW